MAYRDHANPVDELIAHNYRENNLPRGFTGFIGRATGFTPNATNWDPTEPWFLNSLEYFSKFHEFNYALVVIAADSIQRSHFKMSHVMSLAYRLLKNNGRLIVYDFNEGRHVFVLTKA